MPIRQIKSRRKGCKPLVFFKGSPAEAKGIPEEGLIKVFQAAGIDLMHLQIRRIRKIIIQAIENPEKETVYVRTPIGGIFFRVKRLKKGKIGIYQSPTVHGVRKRRSKLRNEIDPFKALKKMLKKGFRTAKGDINVFTRANVKVALPHKSEEKKTYGDRYSLKFMAPAGKHFMEYANVEAASRSQIAGVNIRLAQNLTTEEIAERKRFYRKQIFEKFGIPVHFV